MILILATAVVGCGGAGSSGGASVPTESAALQDLAAMLKSIAEQKKKAPAKAADLDEHEPLFMAACKGITSQKVVYIWGSPYKAGGTDVVAYDAEIEKAGGMVLLQDGTVKQMSADEFKAAPKAKGTTTAGKK